MLRLLRPAESAVRRLILIASHGLVVKPLPRRPLPKGFKIIAKGTGVPRKPRFQLFDTRKRFNFKPSRNTAPKGIPRIWTIDTDDGFDRFVPPYLRPPPPPNTS